MYEIKLQYSTTLVLTDDLHVLGPSESRERHEVAQNIQKRNLQTEPNRISNGTAPNGLSKVFINKIDEMERVHMKKKNIGN